MKRVIHIIAGVGTVFVYKMFTTTDTTEAEMTFVVAGLVGGFIGSVLPDIDYPADLAKKDDKLLTRRERGLKYNHRGVLHTLIVPIILFIINLSLKSQQDIETYKLITSLLDGIIIAYILHLFADMFTPKGIKIGFPIFQKNLSLSKIKFIGWLGRAQYTWIIIYVFILTVVFKQLMTLKSHMV